MPASESEALNEEQAQHLHFLSVPHNVIFVKYMQILKTTSFSVTHEMLPKVIDRNTKLAVSWCWAIKKRVKDRGISFTLDPFSDR